MRFYTHRHKYYCGIDLHTSMMYVCITDETGTILVHKNLRTNPDAFTRLIEPFREDLDVAVECVFVWYWLADLCEQLGVTFVLASRAVHESDSRREGEKRSDRQREDRPTSAQWDAS